MLYRQVPKNCLVFLELDHSGPVKLSAEIKNCSIENMKSQFILSNNIILFYLNKIDNKLIYHLFVDIRKNLTNFCYNTD